MKLTRTPTNCSCNITHDNKYALATFVANNAIASVDKSGRNDNMYKYVVISHSAQNTMQRFKNLPAVKPRSRKPRITLFSISPGVSLQLLVLKRPIKNIGKNNKTKLVQNHATKNGARNSVV